MGEDCVVADLDLRTERRELLAAELRAALTAAIPGSQTGLRGSLASGTADRYSDIGLCWVVPDDRFAVAVDNAVKAVRSVRGVSSLRIDAGPRPVRPPLSDLPPPGGRAAVLAGRSRCPRPLPWRQTTSTMPPTGPPIAKRDGHRQSAPSKCHRRHQGRRSPPTEYHRWPALPWLRAHRPRPRRSCGPAAMIIGLADSCATLEPALTDTAAEVREVVNLS